MFRKRLCRKDAAKSQPQSERSDALAAESFSHAFILSILSYIIDKSSIEENKITSLPLRRAFKVGELAPKGELEGTPTGQSASMTFVIGKSDKRVDKRTSVVLQ